MNKIQFWTLNIASLLLILLLLGHFFLGQSNDRLGHALERDRAAINNARQLEVILDQLSRRIAQASDSDQRLKTILIKYGLNVTSEPVGAKKKHP
jgi:hypothetical protein